MCDFASTAWSVFARQVCRSVFEFMVQCWHLITLNILLCFWDNYCTSISGHLNRSCPAKRGVTWTKSPAAIQNLMEVSVLSELLRCNLWRRRHFINPHRLAWLVKSEVAENRVFLEYYLFRFKKGGCCRCGKLGGIIWHWEA